MLLIDDSSIPKKKQSFSQEVHTLSKFMYFSFLCLSMLNSMTSFMFRRKVYTPIMCHVHAKPLALQFD
uniref:Uncharacterized protein n=1 Tax=Triticum urartu TaxID=4572 RepID=A0A8R7UMH6_TRIUA